MITELTGFPSNVIAIAASGMVQRSDYDTVLVPAVEKAFAAHDKIRLFYEVSPGFTGMAAGAMWEDFKVGVEHITRWERVAVVTDIGWIKHTVEALFFLLPAKVRTFAPDAADDAKTWIEAK